MLKKLLGSIIGFIVGLVLIVGGTILVVNAKYGINIITVGKSLGKLGGTVDVAALAPRAPNYESGTDEATTAATVNAAISGLVIEPSTEDDSYRLSTSVSSTLSQDLRLTDTQCCVLLNWVLNNNEGSQIANIAGKDVDLKDYEFKVVQIQFSEGEEGAINFNVVMSLSLKKIKDKMNGFPFSFLKNKVPDTLYISSTVSVTKTAGAFHYDVGHVSLALNNMSGEEVDKVFQLLNIFAKAGDVSNFNISLGKSFVDALIGNSEIGGFTYSMHDGVGVADFAFEKEGDTIYYVMKTA